MDWKSYLNSDPVKYALMFVTAPIWLPFVKALWRALNDALRDEGGIFGEAPTESELRAMNRELGVHESPLVNTTWEQHENDAGRRAPPRREQRAGTRAPARRRHGFL